MAHIRPQIKTSVFDRLLWWIHGSVTVVDAEMAGGEGGVNCHVGLAEESIDLPFCSIVSLQQLNQNRASRCRVPEPTLLVSLNRCFKRAEIM